MSIISEILHTTDEERCKTALIHYGEALIAIEDYKKRYDVITLHDSSSKKEFEAYSNESFDAYEVYRKQSALVSNLEVYLKQLAREMVRESNS